METTTGEEVAGNDGEEEVQSNDQGEGDETERENGEHREGEKKAVEEKRLDDFHAEEIDCNDDPGASHDNKQAESGKWRRIILTERRDSCPCFGSNRTKS